MATRRAEFLLNSINERIDSKYKNKSEQELARENRQKQLEREATERQQSQEMQQRLRIHKMGQDQQKQNVNFDHERTRQAERTFERMLSRSRERQYTGR
ncbi:MAG: hypothetical protein IKN71_02205 [Alphaproteobacteria bacterium]|nr:hypothetical protein [Alphaproteobacteria bacterium]